MFHCWNFASEIRYNEKNVKGYRRYAGIVVQSRKRIYVFY